MSDQEEVLVSEAEDDQDIIVVDELPKEEAAESPAPDPELQRLRTENEALKKSSDTSSAIKNGFEFLQERLSAGGAAPAPAPVEDEEAFWKGVEEGLFDKAPREALKKAVDRQAKKLIRDELGPLLVSQMESAFENAEWRLRNDVKEGEIFAKYEKDVYAELRKLPPFSQKDPRMLKEVYTRVKGMHLDEIIEERSKKLKETTEEVAKPTASRPRVLMEAGTTHPSGIPTKKALYITTAEDARRQRMGITKKDYMELKEQRSKKH